MLRTALLATTALLAAAACSGSTATSGTEAKATTAATTTPGGSGSSSATPPAAKAATAAASAPAAAAKSGGATDACALITADEVGRVMGATGVKAESQPEVAGASYCMYRGGDGSLIVATSYLRAGAAVFNAYTASAQAQPGLGDKAQWDASSAALQILKGQTVLSITAGDGRTPIERRLELSKQLGAIGAPRQ